MIRRAVLGVFAVVALLLVLACLLVYALLGTTTGNRWLLEQIRDRVPGELIVENWQGNVLGTIRVAGIHYQNGDLKVALDQFSANLHPLTLTQGWVTFEHLTLGNLTVEMPPGENGDSTTNPLPDSLALPVGIRIEQLQVASVSVGDTRLVHDLEGESLAAWRRFQFARLDLQVLNDLEVNVSGHGELAMPYSLESRIRWRQPLPDNEVLSANEAQGELIARGPLQSLELTHDLQQPLAIHSNGHWQYREQQWQADLQHQWQAQPLPIRNDDALWLEAGTLTTRGPLSALQIKGETALQRQPSNQPAQTVQIALDSILSGSRLDLTNLTLRQSSQRLTGKGHLQLQPLQWDLALDGTLDTGIFSPQLPGKLTIKGHSKGQLEGAHWQLEPGTITMTGQLRSQPLTLRAETKGDAENLQIKGQLDWGDNQLTLAGKAWPLWQLNSSFSLAEPSLLDPSMTGSLSGNVRILGQPATPRFSGQLVANNLFRDDLQLTHLNAVFQDLGTGAQPQQLELSLKQLQLSSRPLVDSATLHVQGTLKGHQLTLALQQNEATLRTQLEGALRIVGTSAPAWEGVIHSTRLHHEHLGEWLQPATSPLSLTPTKQQLGAFCLVKTQSQLCAQGSLHANDSLTLDASLDNLPLALFSPLLGADYSLEGTLQGSAQLQGEPHSPQGDIRLETQGARLSFNVQDGPPPWQLDTLSLHTTLAGKQSRSHFLLATALGKVDADITHGFSVDDTLSGQASFHIERLAAVEMLTADLRDVTGKLHGDITLAGTPKTPIIEGAVALREGGALIPALGIAVSNMDLSLTGSPQGRLAVNGQAQMGNGALKVGGYLDPARWPLALQLRFSGQQLLVADRPDAKVWASPDLLLEGTLQGMQLNGKLLIPEANIHPEQLPEGAITVSEDQVLVHQEGDSGQRLPLGMDVTVTLGDKVSFNGFGLNATLGGTLQIVQQPQQPPQLNGELVVLQGRYRAYGQNLAISDGQLIFQGQPDNPGLDIRAYRKIPSEAITVGVQLSGTLQDPEATLYSDPGMEPSQIMSYLLTGRPLEGGTQSDANRIAQALAVYGLEKGSGVTSKIGDKLGVDEITVGSDWETEDAALMLGKQLSERLYLTYAIGLFDAVSTVMLRYTLTRSLHLEARSSSEANSLDLIWEKELR